MIDEYAAVYEETGFYVIHFTQNFIFLYSYVFTISLKFHCVVCKALISFFSFRQIFRCTFQIFLTP